MGEAVDRSVGRRGREMDHGMGSVMAIAMVGVTRAGTGAGPEARRGRRRRARRVDPTTSTSTTFPPTTARWTISLGAAGPAAGRVVRAAVADRVVGGGGAAVRRDRVVGAGRGRVGPIAARVADRAGNKHAFG